MSQRPVPFINAFVWLCLMAATQVAVYAMQANPAPFDAVQPDGSVHTLFLRGNEMFNFVETPEGFQVVQTTSVTTPDMMGKTGDSDKPLWVYAQQNQSTGAVVPSQYALGSVDPGAVGIAPVQLRPGMDSPFAFNTASVLAAAAAASAPEAGLGSTQVRRNVASGDSPHHHDEEALGRFRRVAAKGVVNNLVVMIQWADTDVPDNQLPTVAQMDALFNGPTQSVRDIWSQNSYGQLTVQSTFTGWVKVSVTQFAAAGGNAGRVCC